MTQPFLTEAPKFWERGYSVVPIEPTTKKPAKELMGWQGNINGPVSNAKQREWLGRYANYGIGLLLGTHLDSQFAIGAIDVDDDNLVRAVAAILNGPSCTKRGKKGATFFVKTATADQLRSAQLRDPENKGKIDVLLAGKQTLLPPTIHPETGEPYVWLSTPLLLVEISQLPIFTPSTLKTLKLIVGAQEAWVLVGGKCTHDAGLSLVAKLVAIGCDDGVILRTISSLLPETYEGDTLAELPGWIESAHKKGFGSRTLRPLDDLVAHMIETELAPLAFTAGDGFLHYEDGYWRPVREQDIDRRAKELLSGLIDAKRQVQPLLRSVRECLALNVELKEFGKQTGLIAVRNGTVDVRTGVLEPHSPDHQLRFRLDIDYEPDAECPTYGEQLNQTLLGDAQLIALFDEFCALTLLEDMRYQKALYLVGEAGSGKSTLLKVLEMMHDPAAISVTPLVKIEDERYLTDLVRKLVCISFDVQTAKKVFGEHFVRITGGDPVSVRRLYHEVEGRVVPTVRFIGSMNPDMPGFIAAPDALSRRLIFVPCGRKVAAPDTDRFTKLKAEQPGILVRWVKALQRLERRGNFDVPQVSVLEVDDYISTRDGFDMYAQERLESDPTAKTPISAVTSDYNSWAREMGEAELQPHVIGRKLRRLGFDGGFATMGQGKVARSQRIAKVRLRSSWRGEF
jgi:P4 family phage/plasmid primase-like protien